MQFVILFVVVFGILKLSSCGESETTASTDYCTNTTMPVIKSQSFIERQLKAPSTADFPFLTASDNFATMTSPCNFKVRSYVDSENSFGAMVRTSYTADMKYDPVAETWQMMSVETN